MIILDKAKIEASSKSSSCFQIITPHRAYQVQAKTADEAKEWMKDLKKAVKSYDQSEAPPASAFTYEGKLPDIPELKSVAEADADAIVKQKRTSQSGKRNS